MAEQYFSAAILKEMTRDEILTLAGQRVYTRDVSVTALPPGRMKSELGRAINPEYWDSKIIRLCMVVNVPGNWRVFWGWPTERGMYTPIGWQTYSPYAEQHAGYDGVRQWGDTLPLGAAETLFPEMQGLLIPYRN